MVETRDVAWEATLDVGAPLPQLPEIPEQGRTQGIEDAPDMGGTQDFVSDPTTPPPTWEGGTSRHRRVVPPTTQASRGFRADDVETNDTSAAST